MKQCNFCSGTPENVKGKLLIRGILNAYICSDCALQSVATAIGWRDGKIAVLEKKLKTYQEHVEQSKGMVDEFAEWVAKKEPREWKKPRRK